MSEADLASWIAEAKGDYERVRQRLQDAYLGFIVVRPLPSAPVGRTILRFYGRRTSRCFAPAATVQRVHLAGLEIEVEGLPFQQQDQAVGACATTALWSALARVTRADGGRAVTPLAVTAAATRYLLSGRALPADGGLDMNQTLGAIREFGYSPYVLSSRREQDDSFFWLAVKCYIRSGIPVILRIRHEDESAAHAITVVGFRESDNDEPADDIEIRVGDAGLRAVGLSRLYVHDDRLGPYARMVILPRREQGGLPSLKFLPYDASFEKFASPALVYDAIAPLYPKLRLSAEDLIGCSTRYLPLLSYIAGARREALQVEHRFTLSGQYLRELYELDLDADRLRGCVTSALLSRYVGVVRFLVDEEWFADIVCDSTDIRRDTPVFAPVLLIIPRDQKHREVFQAQVAASSTSG